MKIITSLLIILISLFTVSAQLDTLDDNILTPTANNGQLYDDFSSGSLNPTKWRERPGSNLNNLFTDEHFVNVQEGAYHTAQLQRADRGTKLDLIGYTFVPGDSVEFDVIYHSGSGNQIHFIDANDNNRRGIALFGTWNNERFCAGNTFGLYHVKAFFTQLGVDMEVTKPDNTVVWCRNFGEIQPAFQYRFSVVTRTGDNGIVHMDYDNVYIATIAIPIPPVPVYVESVALWSFDEGRGITTKDLSGNGNHGTLENGVTWTTNSRSGFALNFDGIDGRVNVGIPPSLDLTTAVTLEAWVKRKSNTDGMIISKNGPYYLAIRSNVIEGGIYANSGAGNQWTFVRGNTILQQNRWYKLKVVYDGQNIKVYVNGLLEGSTPKTGRMPYTGQSLFIGWGLPGQNQYFTGILDDVAIYDYPKY